MSTSDKNSKQSDGVQLGEVIKRGREALRLSIRQLAETVDVHHSFLSRLESGDYQTAKPAFLQRLSKVLEIDERDLFSLAGLDAPEGLPAFTPYLRAKYEMSDEAAKALQEYFTYVTDKYDVHEKEHPPAA